RTTCASYPTRRSSDLGYRRQHVNGNGWKDIAYNVAVDQRGNVWTLRGVSKQSGANGTTAANRSHGAVLLLVGNNEQPSAAMIDRSEEHTSELQSRENL